MNNLHNNHKQNCIPRGVNTGFYDGQLGHSNRRTPHFEALGVEAKSVMFVGDVCLQLLQGCEKSGDFTIHLPHLLIQIVDNHLQVMELLCQCILYLHNEATRPYRKLLKHYGSKHTIKRSTYASWPRIYAVMTCSNESKMNNPLATGAPISFLLQSKHQHRMLARFSKDKD